MDGAKTIEKTVCYHCGEHCDNPSIKIGEKPFCCEGCKMVFEILNANDLCNFYELEKTPGISLRGKTTSDFAYLDDEEVKERLIDFTDGTISRATFYLPQIHCASCIWLLENLYRLEDGVLASKVNFLKKTAYLTFEENKTSLRKLVETLASIGYKPEINFDQLQKKPGKAVDKSLFYQIGIAGFAFGNIMLLSFPEYLGVYRLDYAKWFGYINLLLALPVLLYCSRSYLRSAWNGIRQGQLNIDVPISIGILALFGRSAFEILSHSGAGYLDSMAGLIFFLLIGKWFQQATYHTLSFERDYKSYFPIAALVKRKEQWRSIPLNKIKIGDTLLLKNQEIIPVDGLLIKGKGNIDYSFVTGESTPIEKKEGEKLYAGGKHLGSSIELAVTRKVEQSYLTQLWNEQTFKEDTSSASQLADQIGKYFTIAILAIASLTLCYWWSVDLNIAFNAFTAVLIIACPCAVALAIPFTYGNVLRLLAKKQFYLKNTQVIERLQAISRLVFDKTGTITNADQQAVRYEGIELSGREKSWVKTLAAQSSHPLSHAIAAHFKDYPILQTDFFEEYPGQGIMGIVEGMKVQMGSATFVKTMQDAPFSKTYQATNILVLDKKTKHLKRAAKGVFIKINGAEKGYFSVRNQYRKGLSKALQQLKKTFDLSLISGDNDLERQRLAILFGNTDSLYFNQTPLQKLNYIKGLQDQSEKVLMLGDGINDAGALKQSDVGIVITENINNFTPASDAILAASQLEQLPQLLQYIQKSKWVVYGAYLLALIYNIIGLSYAVTGTLSPVVAAILMPLSSVTIVVFGVSISTLLMKSVPSLTTGFSKHQSI